MRQTFTSINKLASSLVAASLMMSGTLFPAYTDESSRTSSPIEHLIVIIGR